MSPDDGSCHSSRISNKSEKNMADFDGEEALSEDELAQIHAQAEYSNPHITPHLSSMASLYHSHLPKCQWHPYYGSGSVWGGGWEVFMCRRVWLWVVGGGVCVMCGSAFTCV